MAHNGSGSGMADHLLMVPGARLTVVFYRLEHFAKIAAFIGLIVTGSWLWALGGVAMMFVGGVLFSFVFRAWLTLASSAQHMATAHWGLRRRRLWPVLVGNDWTLGLAMALWLWIAIVVFGTDADAGVFPELVWAYLVAAGPLRGTDLVIGPGAATLTAGARVTTIVALAVQHWMQPPIWAILVTLVLGMAIVSGIRFGWVFRLSKAVIASSMESDGLDPLVPRTSPSAPNRSPDLVVFPAPTPDGEAFAAHIARVGDELGYAVHVPTQVSQEAVWDACLGKDVVVFDASIEPGADHNYGAALYLLNAAYCVSASRTALPLNYPSRAAIAPEYRQTWTNEVLVPRVSERLRRLRDRVPRPPEHLGFANAEALMDDALAEASRARLAAFNVFVSYRGRYQAQIAALGRSFDADRTLKYFGAGELALDDELLSLAGRWAVNRKIHLWMRDADAVWVYGSPDYLDSWWTRSELVMLSLSGESRPPILLHDPATGATEDLASEYLPPLTKAQRERLDKLLYFSTMPEGAYRLGQAGKLALPRVGLGLRDDVLEQGFTDDLLLQCVACSRVGGTELPLSVGGLLDLTDPVLHGIPLAEAESAAAEAEPIGCPGCGAGYLLTRGEDRHVWFPTRSGSGTGPGGATLLAQPVYRSRSVT